MLLWLVMARMPLVELTICHGRKAEISRWPSFELLESYQFLKYVMEFSLKNVFDYFDLIGKYIKKLLKFEIICVLLF